MLDNVQSHIFMTYMYTTLTQIQNLQKISIKLMEQAPPLNLNLS